MNAYYSEPISLRRQVRRKWNAFRQRVGWKLTAWHFAILEFLCFRKVHVSSSTGSDVIGDGSKRMPFQSLAKGMESLGKFTGRAKLLLKGGDVWREEFMVNLPCKFLVVADYGGGRPVIYCSGLQVERNSGPSHTPHTMVRNMTIVHEVIPSSGTAYLRSTANFSWVDWDALRNTEDT